MTPILPPEALRDYLRHTVCGVPMREIARARVLSPSTIHRRVRDIEVARDCPAIDALVEALCNAFLTPPATACMGDSVDDILSLLSVSSLEVQALHRRAFFAGVHSVMMAPGLQNAALTGAGGAITTTHAVALGLLFLGLAKFNRRVQSALHLNFIGATPAAALVDTGKGKHEADIGGFQIVMRVRMRCPHLLGDDLVAVARRLFDMAEVDPDGLRAILGSDRLGDLLRNFLSLLIFEDIGIVTIEKRLGWSHRSGKVVLAIALDRAAALGI